MLKLAVIIFFATAHASAPHTYMPYSHHHHHSYKSKTMQAPPTPMKAPPAPPKTPPKAPAAPYMFNYNIKDKDGNVQSRMESSDARGIVKGTYAMSSASGLSRDVSYVAGGTRGFTVVVKSNEPGFDASKDPANADFVALPPAKPAPKVAKMVQTKKAPAPKAKSHHHHHGTFLYPVYPVSHHSYGHHGHHY